jgi:hypothetical protein
MPLCATTPTITPTIHATTEPHTDVTPSRPSSSGWSGVLPIWAHSPPIRSIASHATVLAASSCINAATKRTGPGAARPLSSLRPIFEADRAWRCHRAANLSPRRLRRSPASPSFVIQKPTVRATATKFQAMSASHLPARCCQIKRLVVSQFRRDYNGAAVYISRALSLLGPRGIKLSHIVDAGIAQSFLSHIIKDADCVCFGCPLWSSVVAVGHSKPSQRRPILQVRRPHNFPEYESRLGRRLRQNVLSHPH